GKDRAQFAQAFERRFAQAFVAADGAGLAGGLALLVQDRRVDRQDLAVETALGPCLRGKLLRAQPELVELLAGEAALDGDPLGAGELVAGVDGPVVGTAGLASGRLAERHPAHRLDPARHTDVDDVSGDEARDEVSGLL